MEFLAINRPLAGTTHEDLAAVIPDHLRWIAHGLAAGRIVRAGAWGHGGMCIIAAPDQDGAERILRGDPLLTHGLVDVEMAAITPTTAAPARPR